MNLSSLLTWLGDILAGPRCPIHACTHRARGWRTLAHHIETTHPGWEPTP